MERIEKKEGFAGGRAKIKNHRIPVWQIILDIRQGWDLAEILRQRPSITAEDIEACKDYYKNNKSEIDFDIEENLKDD